MLTKVTITGADDSVAPEDLVDLSAKYPFVEWALLSSRASIGKVRFPSTLWIKELMALNAPIKVATHLCGAYVREFLKGDTSFKKEIWNLLCMSARIQINTHGIEHEFNEEAFLHSLKASYTTQHILQYDDVNINIINACIKSKCINVQTLFDLSHGDGILPDVWPTPITGIRCGYAGGLSPDNVEANIHKISDLCKDTPFWIDMETHVRSNNDRQFDLAKVEAVLEISKQYIQ
jgi:hypothetical protein